MENSFYCGFSMDADKVGPVLSCLMQELAEKKSLAQYNEEARYAAEREKNAFADRVKELTEEVKELQAQVRERSEKCAELLERIWQFETEKQETGGVSSGS